MKLKTFFRFPLLNILLIILITVGMGYFISRAELDNDLTKIMPANSSSITALRNTQEMFGSTDTIVIGLRAKQGSILTSENLKLIDEVSQALLQITWNENEAKKTGYKTVKCVQGKMGTIDNTTAVDDLLSGFDDSSTASNGSDDLLGDFVDAAPVATVVPEKDPNDKIPPAPVTGLTLHQTKNTLEISWNDPLDADLSTIEVHYWEPRSSATRQVEKGRECYVAETLTYDETYQITVTAIDINGNRSTPVKTKWTVVTNNGLQMIDDIMSITNSKSIRMVDGELKIERLSEPALPQTEDELKNYIDKLFSWDLYDISLISTDRKSSALYLQLPSGMKSSHYTYLDSEIQKIINQYVPDSIEVYQSGAASIGVKVSEYMRKDLIRLIPLVVLVVLITLFISFSGKIGGVILPLCCVAISTVITVGLMGLLGKRIDIVATTIPVALIAIGSAYGIHVMTHYYEELKVRGKLSGAEHRELVFEIMKNVGIPVFLAGITTVAGFISFVSAPVETLRNFGIFTAFGVGIAIIASIIFLPSVLLLRQRGIEKKAKVQRNNRHTKKHHFFLKAIFFIYRFLTEKAWRTVALFTIVLAISAFGISRIRIDSQPISYFRTNCPVYIADRYLCSHFAGTNTLDITISGNTAGALTNPDVIAKMAQLADFVVDKYPDIKKTMGYPDFIKKMNEVMNSDGTPEQNAKFFEIPTDYQKYGMENKDSLKNLIVQYLLLLGDDVSHYAYGADLLAPEAARVTLIMTQANKDFIDALNSDIKNFCAENLPEGYSISVSGTADYLVELNNLIISSQIQSIILSALMIFLFLMLQYRSVTAGIIGIAPLALAVILNFGMMGIFGITLNIGTAIIASVAIGMGVDYTIHFLAAYKQERAKSNDLKVVTKNTLIVAGKAIIANTAAVCLGFLVLVISNFTPLVNVGILLSLIMITSSLGALVLLPAILKFTDPKFLRPIEK